tara:strand:+ start:500 stop:724 length:225 start_codon:yes stop_codon:yes gene_type:complete
MELSDIIKSFLLEIGDEIKEKENMILLKKNILQPIIKEIIEELYPSIMKIMICFIIVLLLLMIMIFLNIQVIYS